MIDTPRTRAARLLALLLPLALLGGAWGSQLLGGLVPCEMCQWQRWPHYAALMLAILAFLPIWPVATPGELTGILAAVVLDFVGSGLVAAHMAYTFHWTDGSGPWIAFIVGALIGTIVTVIAVLLPNRVAVALAALAIAFSGMIGVYHAGVEYHWWEGITPCSADLASGPGDALTRILRAPMIRCDAPQWTLAGVSLAGFNALFSLSGAAAILWLLRTPGHPVARQAVTA